MKAHLLFQWMTPQSRKAGVILFAQFLSVVMERFETKSKVKFKTNFWTQLLSWTSLLYLYSINMSIWVNLANICSLYSCCCFLDPEVMFTIWVNCTDVNEPIHFGFSQPCHVLKPLFEISSNKNFQLSFRH